MPPSCVFIQGFHTRLPTELPAVRDSTGAHCPFELSRGHRALMLLVCADLAALLTSSTKRLPQYSYLAIGSPALAITYAPQGVDAALLQVGVDSSSKQSKVRLVTQSTIRNLHSMVAIHMIYSCVGFNGVQDCSLFIHIFRHQRNTLHVARSQRKFSPVRLRQAVEKTVLHSAVKPVKQTCPCYPPHCPKCSTEPCWPLDRDRELKMPQKVEQKS